MSYKLNISSTQLSILPILSPGPLQDSTSISNNVAPVTAVIIVNSSNCHYFINIYTIIKKLHCGPGSSVGIATKLGLDGPGSNPGGDRDFPPVHTGPGAHPASCKMGTGSFPVVKCGPGVLLTTHPLLVPWSWKSRAIPLPTLWATPGL